MRKIYYNLGLLLASILICFLFAEAALRIIDGIRDKDAPKMNVDKLLHHSFPPDATFNDSGHGIAVEYVTNNESFLSDYNVSLIKNKGAYRIFYVGDSNTQGSVNKEDRLVSLISKKLNNDCNQNIEVINTGTSSYSFLPYYLLIKNKVLKYKPDLIIINIDMTDVANDYQYKKSIKMNGTEIVALDPSPSEYSGYMGRPGAICKIPIATNEWVWLTQHFHFFKWMHKFFVLYYEKNTNSPCWDYSANWFNKSYSAQIEANVDFSLDVLNKTILLAKEKGVSIALVSVPHYPQFDESWSNRPHYILKNFSMAIGVPYLNTYESLYTTIHNTNVTDYYWKNDPSHFNVAGNKIWADAQFKFLLNKSNHLLPTSCNQ